MTPSRALSAALIVTAACRVALGWFLYKDEDVAPLATTPIMPRIVGARAQGGSMSRSPACPA